MRQILFVHLFNNCILIFVVTIVCLTEVLVIICISFNKIDQIPKGQNRQQTKTFMKPKTTLKESREKQDRRRRYSH